MQNEVSSEQEPMASKGGRVLLLAAASRALTLLAILAFDAVFQDLDTSARFQNRSCDRQCAGDPDCGVTDGSPATLLDDVASWDGVFFVRIAKCGYETDMIHAFFPMLPLVMRLGTPLLGMASLGTLSYESCAAFTALLFNIVAFSLAALGLWKLTVQVLGDEQWADWATLFFCFNPASVFYSVVYTESLFAAATFWGLVLLPRSSLLSTSCFVVAAATRSNGILACWFVLYDVASTLIRPPFRTAGGAEPGSVRVGMTLLAAAFKCVCICAPYALMQAQAYAVFCTPRAEAVGLQRPPWCDAALPSLYGYVQKTYWDVGFLRFYAKLNRWPKVLQSVPVLGLSVAGCWSWAAADWSRAIGLGLLPMGRQPRSPSGKQATGPTLRQGRPPSNRRPGDGLLTPRRSGLARSKSGVWPAHAPALAPLICHWALMTAVAALAMHVNVATRFLSSAPPLHWYIAALLQREGPTRYLLWGWSLLFIALGTLMLPNFYPWT